MSKKLVALSTLALLLAACGSPKKSPDDPSMQPDGPGGQSHYLRPGDFEAQCRALGFLSNDLTACLVPHRRSISDNEAKRNVTIWEFFRNGMFLVSMGTPGAVVITLNGHRIADANTRKLFEAGEGELAFEVLLSSQSKASAVAYECFDRFSDDGKMRPIYCDPNKIP